MDERIVSVVVPVYNEDANIQHCLRALSAALAGMDHEILVCYDFDEDRTLAAIEAMEDRPRAVRLVRNRLGRGVACALRAGFAAARGDVIVTTMADLSDPPEAIPAMAEKIRREGAHVVSGSRYMRGGSQECACRLKAVLSRLAGLSLRWVAGLGTHDATNNFRAYSRDFLRWVEVESTRGFEDALELTVKAHLGGWRVAEVPVSWRDRRAGESRFRLWAWLPAYLRWYGRAMAVPLLAIAALLASLAALVALESPAAAAPAVALSILAIVRARGAGQRV